MRDFEEKRKNYTDMLTCQIDGISKILRVNGVKEIISLEIRDELSMIRSKAERLKRKLETNEFEIAIVGLEKAGKSTFANALMGNDILPTKDERCTYTSTSIRYGSNDEAEVTFFSSEQFNEDFNNKLIKLGIDEDAHVPFYEWTIEKFRKAVSDDSSEMLNLRKDVEGIIENRSSIKYLLDSDKRTYGVDKFETDVKRFIEDPSMAVAVKEIVIHSTKLVEMKNAVIYDVPGFDSPTQMHKDQTMMKMRQADAILLVVPVDRPSFNDSLVSFFTKVGKDDDGIDISDKIFVFGNRADAVTTLEENRIALISELTNYNVIGSSNITSRLILGSAKARIDREKRKQDSPAIIGINTKGITDGIDEIRNALEKYNQNERLDALSQKTLNFSKSIYSLMEILKGQNEEATSNIDDYETAKNEIKISSPMKICEYLGACRTQIIEKCREEKPITQKICSNIIHKISNENYMITDDEIVRVKNLSQAGVEIISHIDAGIREEKFTAIYNDFIDGVVNLAVDEHNESNQIIQKAFISGLGILEDSKWYDSLSEQVSNFITEHIKISAPAGYYSSLIRRYSRDLFEILIGIPYAVPERYTKFVKNKMNFYSLSLFDANYDVSILPGKQLMHSQILFHSTLAENVNDIMSDAVVLTENIINEIIMFNDKIYIALKEFVSIYQDKSIDKLKELYLPFNYSEKEETFDSNLYHDENTPIKEAVFQTIRNCIDSDNKGINASEITSSEYKSFFVYYEKSLEGIKAEFSTDLTILHDILENQVMKAIAIETPFVDLIMQEISDIMDSTREASFLNFIDENAEFILAEKSAQILVEKSKREKKRAILQEVTAILQSIPQ